MPQDNKGGRPEKLTPELQDTIIKALGLGLYAETACDLAGIAPKTYYDWLKQGEAAKSGKYHRFCNAVKKTTGEAEGRALAHIQKDATWQSKAWYLERRYRKRWGRNQPPEAPGNIEEIAQPFIDGMNQVEEGE